MSSFNKENHQASVNGALNETTGYNLASGGEDIYSSSNGAVITNRKADEIDFERYGVDPILDKYKTTKEKGPSIFKLLNPKFLQTEVSRYGYNFSAKRFFASVGIALAAAVGLGFLFKLEWYFILAIGIVCLLCVPSIVVTSYKNMYESKKFHDVSNYMEQLLHSFKRKRKVLPSLEDVLVAFEDDNGPMKELIEQAINYIRVVETDGDIYREAFNIIEKEYSNDRLRNVHNFLISVENNGGDVDAAVDLLQDERAMWDERTHTFQKERNAVKKNVTVSIVCSMMLCAFILIILSFKSLADLNIIKNIVVQISSTLVIVFNVFLYVKVVNKLSQDWLKRGKKYTDYQILRDYFSVVNYDKKKATRNSLLWGLAFSPIIALGFFINNKLVIVIGVLLVIVGLFSHRISHNLCRKTVIKEIEKAFPQWLMELAMILQGDNVPVAISKTLNSAPVVLRPELDKLLSGLEENPSNMVPYNKFFEGFDLPEIKSAMRMLYSVTNTGAANIGEQLTDLIKKQNVLMDKAEKINNDEHLAGLSTLNMLPMLFCIFKSLVDMTILVFSLFTMIQF